MSDTEAIRQNAFTTIPVAGTVFVAASSTIAASLDFATVGPQGQRNDGSPTRLGVVGLFVGIQADTQAVFVIAGPTLASVTGANAPSSTATGTNAAGCAFKIEAGTTLKVKITPQTRYLGFVGATGGFVRIAAVTYTAGS